MIREPRGKTQSEDSKEFQSERKGNIQILYMRHCNALESTVDMKGKCMENRHWISLLNKITINSKESLFFQLKSVVRCLSTSRRTRWMKETRIFSRSARGKLKF